MGRKMSIKIFFALLVASFMLPQTAYCQDKAPDTLAFAEPEQFDFKPVEIKKHEPDIEMAKKYCEMAIASDNIDTIMKYAALSLEYCKSTDSALISSDYYELGYAYYMKDDARDALDYTFKAIHVYDDSTKNKYVAQAFLGVGLCYEDLNEPDSIFLYFNKALQIYITLRDTVGVAVTYKDLADVYMHMKMYANAARHWNTL